jgi:cell wall-associated NlpC family hydrolase
VPSARLVTTLQGAAAAVKQKRDALVVARAQARTYLGQVSSQKASIGAAVARQQHIFATAKATVRRIQKEEAVAAARAAAAASGTTWRNPRLIPPEPWGRGHPEVIAVARKYLGIPYVYAAADPKVGFDCSGLVMYCYAQIGIILPHYSGFQQNMGTPVPMNALIPGDLVFMGYPVSYHVALYAGPGQVIQAPYTGAVVSYGSLAGFQYAVRLP